MDTVESLPRSYIATRTVAGLVIAYLIGREVGRHQTLRVVKALGKNGGCNCSQ